MTQADLDREVSHATGESMGIIRKHGFLLLPLPDDSFENEPDNAAIQTIDWDLQDALHRRAA